MSKKTAILRDQFTKDESRVIEEYIDLRPKDFAEKNNIAQAFEVLEAVKSDKIDTYIESCKKGWVCTIEDHRDFIDVKIYSAESPLLSEAIFNAVKKYRSQDDE